MKVDFIFYFSSHTIVIDAVVPYCVSQSVGPGRLLQMLSQRNNNKL